MICLGGNRRKQAETTNVVSHQSLAEILPQRAVGPAETGGNTGGNIAAKSDAKSAAMKVKAETGRNTDQKSQRKSAPNHAKQRVKAETGRNRRKQTISFPINRLLKFIHSAQPDRRKQAETTRRRGFFSPEF